MSVRSGFKYGMGRFSRARGNSFFSKVFNGDKLPRHLLYSFPSLPTNFARLGESPICGFAEQNQPLIGLVNALRLSSEISDEEAAVLDASDNAGVMSASLVLDAIELIACLREWSGIITSRDCGVRRSM